MVGNVSTSKTIIVNVRIPGNGEDTMFTLRGRSGHNFVGVGEYNMVDENFQIYQRGKC